MNILKFFVDTRRVVLKKCTRVIDDYVVTFYLVRKTVKFLKLIEFADTQIMHTYDESKVPLDKKYRMDMLVKSAAYAMLAANSDLILNYEETKNA